MLKVQSVIFQWLFAPNGRNLWVGRPAKVDDQCQQLSSHRGNRGTLKLSNHAGLFSELVSVNVKVMASQQIIRKWRTSPNQKDICRNMCSFCLFLPWQKTLTHFSGSTSSLLSPKTCNIQPHMPSSWTVKMSKMYYMFGCEWHWAKLSSKSSRYGTHNAHPFLPFSTQ